VLLLLLKVLSVLLLLPKVLSVALGMFLKT